MSTITVRDVEDTLLDSLVDLGDELIRRQLECSDDQAVVLLRKFQAVQEEILMFLSPTMCKSWRDEDVKALEKELRESKRETSRRLSGLLC